MKSNRLAGHELPQEGRIYVHGGYRNSEGATSCSCGQKSPVLKNTARRKAWHYDHKDDIRQGGDGVVWEGVN